MIGHPGGTWAIFAGADLMGKRNAFSIEEGEKSETLRVLVEYD